MKQEKLNTSEIAKKASTSIIMVISYIVIYVVAAALVQWLFSSLLPRYGVNIVEYMIYIQILLSIMFGYLIVNRVALFFYWSMRAKHDHATAAAIRSIVRIIGIGAMIAAIAGGVAGGAAGVALGGFMGMVIGFASQQILGQAISGLFILISRPFKINDPVIIAGEEGIVEDISTLFTTVIKTDGTKVLVPNNSIIGGKIYLKPKTK